MKEKIKNNKGISLLVLVITVLVLILLAGTTISMISGDGLLSGIEKEENELQQEVANRNQIAQNYLDHLLNETIPNDDEDGGNSGGDTPSTHTCTYTLLVDKKEPTCTETGFEKYKCTCDNTEIKEIKIPAKGHTFVQVKAIAATCTTVGKTSGEVCSVCNMIRIEQEKIPALGHSIKTTTKAATCTTAGTSTTKCTRTGCTYSTTSTIPALGHYYNWEYSYDGDWKYGQYICSRCGDIADESSEYIGDNTIDDNTIGGGSGCDHDYQEVEVIEYATCKNPGISIFRCIYCGDEYEGASNAYAGHVSTYTSYETGICEHTHMIVERCEYCGDSVSEYWDHHSYVIGWCSVCDATGISYWDEYTYCSECNPNPRDGEGDYNNTIDNTIRRQYSHLQLYCNKSSYL